jgi:uncharacterized membrane-anchored protein
VEGLSVAAIAYYALGLISYAAKAVKELGVHLVPELVAGVALPGVLFLLWRHKQSLCVHEGTQEDATKHRDQVPNNNSTGLGQ